VFGDGVFRVGPVGQNFGGGIGITRDTTTAVMFVETMDTMVIITLVA
jgi:hypothetical protein